MWDPEPIEAVYSCCNSLISIPIYCRYEGLAATHQGLVERNGAIAKSIEDGNRELDSLKNEMDQQKLVSNQEMTDMQAQHERLAIKISQLETKAGM